MKIRKPAVSGQFYTSEPDELAREVKKYIDDAVVPVFDKSVKALIAPHAGYSYSGWVAGYAFKCVQGKEYSSVVVISPSHMEHFDFVSIYAGDSYRTPLGDITIDSSLSEALTKNSRQIRINDKGHEGFSIYGRGEHALEVELPFLQIALKSSFTLVPLVMGDQNFELCRNLGQTLALLLKDKNVLVVASSDLSHFHDYDTATKMDRRLLEQIEKFDMDGFYRIINSGKSEACGWGPIVVAMIAGKAMGAERCHVLKYANSGDVPFGEKESVVGYASVAIV